MTDHPATPIDELPTAPGLAQEEHVRLVSGFADLFSAAVLATGLTALGGAAAATGPLAGLLVAGAAWFLAIPLVRERRFAACAIVLTLAITLGVLGAGFIWLNAFAVLVAAGAAWQTWRVHKIPLAAALTFAVPLTVLGGLAGLYRPFGIGTLERSSPAVVLLIGAVLFALAMRWDLSDRDRTTRRSDVGFWLHMAAAPLIAHGTFGALGVTLGTIGAEQLGLIAALFALFAVVAVLIDRRPILVSSLSYLLYAMITQVDRNHALGGAAAIALVLGGGILVLAVGWNSLRRAMLWAAPTALSGRLVPAMRHTAPVPEPPHSASETEPLRLVFGFNDIFVSIGLIALIAGSVLLSTWWFPLMPADSEQGVPPVGWHMLLVPLAAIWGAAEYFVRHRRMALPGIVLALFFALLSWAASAVFIEYAAMPLLSQAEHYREAGLPRSLSGAFFALIRNYSWAAAGIVLAANLLFGWRQRVPISIALGTAGLLIPVLCDAYIFNQQQSLGSVPLPLISPLRQLQLWGGLAFAAAAALDWSDRARVTLRSDMAFWLHLGAALAVLPIAFGNLADWPLPPLGSALLLYTGVLLGAIVLDRRVGLLIGLPFVLHAMTAAGQDGELATATVCAVLIVCGLVWQKLRAAILPSALRQSAPAGG